MAPDTNANIAACLPRLAAADPHRPAVICAAGHGRDGRARYVHMTFRQLDRDSDRLARGLAAAGVEAGDRVALMVRPGLDFFALTFALFKAGAVLVAIDPGIGRHHLKACLAEAAPSAFIGVAAAHLARKLLAWGRDSIRTTVIAGPAWPGLARLRLGDLRRLGAAGPAGPRSDAGPEDDAAILYTSGSTGPPKGAVYTHENFGAQVGALRDAYGLAPGERFLSTFPLFGLFAPALGMTGVVPEMDFTRPGRVDPRRIVEPIEDLGVTHLFGSPALLDRMVEWGAPRRLELPTLRGVISAGAPVPAGTLAAFSEFLTGGAEVFTPYGATESLPVSSVGSREVLEETRAATERGGGICVGLPVATISARVIAITDDPVPTWDDAVALPAGEIGEIVVRGPMVTSRYHNRPSADALAKIRDADGGIFHRMGDLGYLDAAGRLWFCGRKSERVTTPAGELYTAPCEAIFNLHPRVRRTALVGVRRDGTVRPALCVELAARASRPDRERIRRELLALGAAHPATDRITEILFHPGFPVDRRHNAKIGRAELARWAEEQRSCGRW